MTKSFLAKFCFKIHYRSNCI